jgi:hypothetical protein
MTTVNGAACSSCVLMGSGLELRFLRRAAATPDGEATDRSFFMLPMT